MHVVEGGKLDQLIPEVVAAQALHFKKRGIKNGGSGFLSLKIIEKK
jgi:hypothetical protein